MTEESPKKNMRTIWIITLIFVLIGVAGFLYWLFVWRFEESTRDAYVHGNQVVVTPQISGYIASISVNDTEFVEEGRVLIELDRIDRKMAFDTTKSTLAETVRNVTQMFENVGALKGQLEASKAAFAKTAKDYKHRKALVESGGVSREEFQHAEAFFIEAFANMLTVQHNLRGALALVENTTIETHPLVERAIDDLREAFVNLSRCTIRSPVSGIVAMKKAQVGESISAETPLMMIVPLDQIWVDANFKEVQLKNVRLGQPVKLKSDIYGGDMVYQGEVIGIAAATGSVMSVLPPQNATGNWIKIVQRLPVRVRLEPGQLKDFPLRLGLSMDVTVDIHNTSGKMIPEPPPPGAKYSTDVFNKQEEGVDEIIQKILKENQVFGSSDAKTTDG
ncbi:MAG: efflux RND transporter periplasmic adaptor subunit [Simkaniaceae bacterium]|nr:efflux RND transporter periplasmic adaptor subunit [Candidatus Sacchlamyda saccharinae]